MALVASVLPVAPWLSFQVIAGAVLASATVALALAAISLWAWPRHASMPWFRAARTVAFLWACAFLFYPGLMSPVPVLQAVPYWMGASGVSAVVLATFALPGLRPTLKEMLLLTATACALFASPGPGAVDVAATAGRPIDERDVLLLGFDSVSQQDSAAVLDVFSPTHGRKTLYTNAWTPISTTSTAWRTVFSNRYPGAEDLWPGAKWPADHRSWLPRELALHGYTSVMMQDEPATNVYGANEWVHIPGQQGWQSVMKDFVWRAVFPLSIVGGHWWVAALGGPANSVTRFAYSPDWFRHDVLRELALAARSGPVLWASHSCYVHAPLHLSLREAMRLDRWWSRSPRALEGTGNPFTDADAGGKSDVLEARMESIRHEIGVWLNELDRQRILGRALVVFLSDHGPRGPWVPREVTEHIQLAVFAPGPRIDSVVRQPVSLVDVAPTVRAHLGISGASGPGLPLPSSEPIRAGRRLLGRVDAVTLDSAGIKLETITAAAVRASLTFEGDGSYVFSPPVRPAGTSGLGGAGGIDVIQFVDHGG